MLFSAAETEKIEGKSLSSRLSCLAVHWNWWLQESHTFTCLYGQVHFVCGNFQTTNHGIVWLKKGKLRLVLKLARFLSHEAAWMSFFKIWTQIHWFFIETLYIFLFPLPLIIWFKFSLFLFLDLLLPFNVFLIASLQEHVGLNKHKIHLDIAWENTQCTNNMKCD